MAQLLSGLSADYDLVIVDTPPLAILADAIPLLELMSGVLIVGQLGRTTRDDAVALSDQLRHLEAPVLGVVANRASHRLAGYGYSPYGRY
jgi:Mrp family chromosome partitioning ATPase